MNIKQLRAPIAALQDATMDENKNFHSSYDEGKFDALSAVDALLDSLQEEPVSEDLEEVSKEWLRPQLDKSYANYGEAKMMELTHFDGYAMLDAIEFGAKWQKEQFEKERLKHCDALTAEQAQIEFDFVTNHLKKHNRTPTFIDAIEYGMRLQKEQKMKGKMEVKIIKSE